MNVTGGSVDVTTYFVLRLAADGTEATGLTISNIDLQYVRTGANPVAKVDAVALAATDTAHTDNRAIEVDATDQPGLYRVDWPDAAFAAGVREVILSVKCATVFTEHLAVQIDSPVNATSIDSSTSAATHLKDHAVTAVPVTFTTGGSTTTAVLVNVDGAAASSTDDFYNGRVLIFTAPSGLQYQATDITGYVGSTKTATITQVTTAPGATTTAILV